MILEMNTIFRKHLYDVLVRRLPKNCTPLALHEDGLLFRSSVGTLAIFQGDRMINCDRVKTEEMLLQRKIIKGE